MIKTFKFFIQESLACIPWWTKSNTIQLSQINGLINQILPLVGLELPKQLLSKNFLPKVIFWFHDIFLFFILFAMQCHVFWFHEILFLDFSEPNRTDPEEIVAKIKSGDSSLKTANLNNIPISEEKFLILCEALRNNEVLEELCMANTMMGDFVAANLAAALESNTKLLKLNIESNSISPQCLVKIFEVYLTRVFF